MNRGWKMLTGFLLAVGLVALAIAPAEAARHEVKIEQYAYGPSSMNITQGDTVTWTNLDSVEHDVVVTSGPESFRSPMLSKGQSWSHTFTTPGSYSYICSVHPDMRASLTAAAAVQAPVTSAPVTPTTTPQTAQSAATAPSATPGTGKHTPKATKTPTATPAAQPAVTTTVPAATTTSTLDPLLLVAGAAIAVVVFCLLLMSSRPVYQLPAEAPTAGDEPHTDIDSTISTK